jgi:hypothetical protein
MIVRKVENIRELRDACQDVYGEAVFGQSQKYVLTFKRYRKMRSVKQNKLYWSWMNLLEKETGTEKEDIHNYFSGLFLRYREVKVMGETKLRKVSTTELDTKEFTEYLDKVWLLVNDKLEIQLPLPEDQNFDEFYLNYGE